MLSFSKSSIFAAALSGFAGFLTLVPQAGATTFPILVDDSPNGDVYKFRVDGLTEQTTFNAGFSVTPSFNCQGNSRNDFPACTQQFIFGSLTAVAQFVAPQNPRAIELCNGTFGENLGTGSCSRTGHSAFGFLTPENPFVELTLQLQHSLVAGSSYVASLVLDIGGLNPVNLVQLSGPVKGGEDVPLPAAFPLLAMGLGALGLLKKQRARRS